MGNAANAARAYERANSLDKGNVASSVRLAQARFAAGDTARAVSDLESISKADSTQYQSDLALITAHIRRREFDQALAAVSKLEQKQPENRLPTTSRALYTSVCAISRTPGSFEKALQLQPSNFTAAQPGHARLAGT
jgi:Tfp pilus assembly protein PilF